mgnify:CR=1 FL=1
MYRRTAFDKPFNKHTLMRKQNYATMLCGIMVGATIFSACVDDQYDLGNLDATIQLGQGSRFTLPTSDVDSIKLSNLFDIDEGSAIDTINGTYFVNTSGNADPTTVNVDVIDINKPKDQHFDAHLVLQPSSSSGVKAQGPRKEGTTESAYIYDIKNAEADIENARASNISSDVRAINRIKFIPTTYSLSVTVSGQNIDVFKKMTFENLILHLPKGFGVTSCIYMGHELLEDASLRETLRSTGELDISDRLKAIGETLDYKGFLPAENKPIQLSLVLEAAEVLTTTSAVPSGAHFNPSAHTAAMDGEIKLSGYVSIAHTDVDPVKLQTHYDEIKSTLSPTDRTKIETAIAAGNFQPALDVVINSIDFVGDGAFSSSMEVNKFSGEIQHSINDINPIELNDLPDFLTEDGVSLDLYDPQIFLMMTLKSPNDGIHKLFRQSITTSVDLKAYQDGIAEPTGHANTGDITFDLTDVQKRLSYVDGSDNVDVLITRVYSNDEFSKELLPSDYRDLVLEHANQDFLANFIKPVKANGLNNLLNKVPNRVDVKGGSSDHINVVVDCEDVELPLHTSIALEYTVYTPLEFGQEFTIVYTESEDGWAEDMDDLEDINFDGIEIAATVESKNPVPLSMTISAKALAMDGSEIPELEVNSVTVPAGSTSYPITLIIKPKAGHIMRDFFKGVNGVKKLDGIKYKATMDSATQGAALQCDQYIQLKNVKITLVGGITYYDDDED